MKKKGFTLEQHKAIGKELHAMRELLMAIEVSISHAYQLPMTRRIDRALNQIDQARSDLDDCLCKEQREHIEQEEIDGRKLTYVYYPGERTRELGGYFEKRKIAHE